MEAEAREMSRCAAEAARRSCRTVDVADWSDGAAEAEEMSLRAANVAEMSSRAAAAWENVSRAGEDSYRRMHAIVHS